MKRTLILAAVLALAACGGGSSKPATAAGPVVAVRPGGVAEVLVHVPSGVDGPTFTYAVSAAPRLGTLIGAPPACYYQAGSVTGDDVFTVRAHPTDGSVIDISVSVTVHIRAGGASATAPDATPLPWPTWTPHPAPIYTGYQDIASDPSVIPRATGYLMAYTGIDWANPLGPRAAICLADSVDGLTWTPRAGVAARLPGSILLGRPGSWEEDIEAACLIDRGTDLVLLYSGYVDLNGQAGQGFPASLGAAISRDGGASFARVATTPVMKGLADGFDHDAIYSPTVVRFGGGWLMIYAGHCYTAPTAAPGLRLLGATSLDAIHWTRLAAPVLEGAATPAWTRDGVAEPGLIQGPDGWWYLFLTGLRDADRVIGQARARTPFGPWTIAPTPAIPSSSTTYGLALAPSLLRVGDVGRMWFLVTDAAGSRWVTDYAEAPWPAAPTAPN